MAMDSKRIKMALLVGLPLIILFTTVPCKNLFGLLGMLLFTGFATWEFYGLLSAGGIKVSKKWGTVSGLIFVAATWFHMTGHLADNMLWTILVICIVPIFFRILAYPDLKTGLESSMGTILGLVYVPLLWSFVVRLFLSGNHDEPGWAAFYIILCMKMSDSGGYFFGMNFGKHKLAPVISPKKSWEGLLGGFVFCGAINLIWLLFKDEINSNIPLTFGHAIVLSILIPVVGTIGDLVESMFKRAVNVKDSNTMVYGLGGVLDMVDSVLFAAPMLYVYIELFIK